MSGKSGTQAAPVRVQRYYAGKVPQFPQPSAGHGDDEDQLLRHGGNKKAPIMAPSEALALAFSAPTSALLSLKGPPTSADQSASSPSSYSHHASPTPSSDGVVAPAQPQHLDRRMRRLQQLEQETRDFPSRPQPSTSAARSFGRRRPVFEGEVVADHVPSLPSTTSPPSSAADPSSADAVNPIDEERVVDPIGQGEGNSEDSSEEDDEDDEGPGPVLLRPVFIPKQARSTIKTVEELKRDEEKLLLDKGKQDELRREESYRLVEAKVQAELKSFEMRMDTVLSVDDMDDVDPEAERQAWQLRELTRIQRDRQAYLEREREKAELERRRQMTDSERLEDDQKAGVDRFNKEKSNMKFMQRYYHKGAFYQESEILKRDYNQPTLEDRYNKEVLPEILQTRKSLGLRGATKWTHLANEDTSRKDAAWSQKTDINMRMVKRQGGMRYDLDRPTAKRRT